RSNTGSSHKQFDTGDVSVNRIVGDPLQHELTLQIEVTIGAPTMAATAPSPVTEAARAVQEGIFSSARDIFADASPRFSTAHLKGDRFTWPTALNMALCSHLAYQTGAFIEDYTRTRWSFSTCKSIASDNTECFVASTADAVVLAFRGTQEIADWLINLNAISKYYPPYG